MLTSAVFDASPAHQDVDDVPTIRPQLDDQRDTFLGVIGRHRSPSISSDHGANAAAAAVESVPVSLTTSQTQHNDDFIQTKVHSEAAHPLLWCFEPAKVVRPN